MCDRPTVNEHFIHLFQLTLRSDGARYEAWIVIEASEPQTVVATFATEDEARDDAGARNGDVFMKAQRAGAKTGFEAHA